MFHVIEVATGKAIGKPYSYAFAKHVVNTLNWPGRSPLFIVLPVARQITVAQAAPLKPAILHHILPSYFDTLLLN